MLRAGLITIVKVKEIPATLIKQSTLGRRGVLITMLVNIIAPAVSAGNELGTVSTTLSCIGTKVRLVGGSGGAGFDLEVEREAPIEGLLHEATLLLATCRGAEPSRTRNTAGAASVRIWRATIERSGANGGGADALTMQNLWIRSPLDERVSSLTPRPFFCL